MRYRLSEVPEWILADPAVYCAADTKAFIHSVGQQPRREKTDERGDWLLCRCRSCGDQVWKSIEQYPLMYGLWHKRDVIADFVIREQP